MKKSENIRTIEEAILRYLQPVFDKHFNLHTWAGVWAYENTGSAGSAFDKLLRHIPIVKFLSGEVSGYAGSDPWQAVCGLTIGISLKGEDLYFRLVVNQGKIVHLELEIDEISDAALEMDLSKEFGKQLTWLAVSS